MDDHKLVKYLLLLLALPIGMATCSGDRFRYQCQDPNNWEKDFCKPPQCDVTRSCPEHIFKGQRDPRIGPHKDDQNKSNTQSFAPTCAPATTQGGQCGK